jgi:deazaflavin-dependent oxidoreductase (nitroreductase family)
VTSVLAVDPKHIMQHLVTQLHVRVYQLTGGKLGGRIGHAEHIVLTTTGRKSGARRTTPLTVTVDGDRLVLVASNGGAARHPDWYLNLTANPDVLVQRGARQVPMRARTATPDERPQLWSKVVATYQGYDGYQRKTSREIPLVVCEPVPDR